MDEQEVRNACLDLIERSQIVIVGTVNTDGFPEIRAMLNMEHDGLREFWFSTNTSSRKIAQLKANPKGCVYYVDSEAFRGVTLTGTFEILQDKESRQRLWREGFEQYYPLGVDDPDYSVLHFTATQAEHYHGLKTVRFDV
ncbi:MAG: pyridoxamine 5'-phosphate oxidase family protein [Candidatus Zixiibacteriota bacterium]|nr:MAG: pyridoxamine 5'-phosphate oxidase family protein [candidate division Zixibacteria bacterium]